MIYSTYEEYEAYMASLTPAQRIVAELMESAMDLLFADDVPASYVEHARQYADYNDQLNILRSLLAHYAVRDEEEWHSPAHLEWFRSFLELYDPLVRSLAIALLAGGNRHDVMLTDHERLVRSEVCYAVVRLIDNDLAKAEPIDWAKDGF